jgi:hypothetical protein
MQPWLRLTGGLEERLRTAAVRAVMRCWATDGSPADPIMLRTPCVVEREELLFR